MSNNILFSFQYKQNKKEIHHHHHHHFIRFSKIVLVLSNLWCVQSYLQSLSYKATSSACLGISMAISLNLYIEFSSNCKVLQHFPRVFTEISLQCKSTQNIIIISIQVHRIYHLCRRWQKSWPTQDRQCLKLPTILPKPACSLCLSNKLKYGKITYNLKSQNEIPSLKLYVSTEQNTIHSKTNVKQNQYTLWFQSSSLNKYQWLVHCLCGLLKIQHFFLKIKCSWLKCFSLY